MTNIVNELSIQLPIVLSDDEAAQIAEKLLYRAWTERTQFEIALSMKYAKLDAGDVLQVEADGNTYVMRVQNINMSLPGVIKVKATADRASLYVSQAVGGSASYPDQTLTVIGDTIVAIMDLPALSDTAAATPGYYVAAYGVRDSWSSGMLFKSGDGGATWSGILNLIVEATMGTATDVLADHIEGDWDDKNTVNITMGNGTLSSDTEINVLNGANVAAFGADDRWEIIGFQIAQLQGDDSYTLSHLIRGMAGSEHAISQHAVGDTFVLLSTTTVYRATTTYSAVGTQYKYKAASNGQALQDVSTEHDLSMDDANAKPWSVVQIHGERDGSNDLAIGWQRRSRYSASTLWTPQLGEETELYEIDIKSGAATLRTLQATTNSVIYEVDQQTADGLTPGNPVTVEIYQISATVGRGYPAGETI